MTRLRLATTFNLPWAIRPEAIADRLYSNKRVLVKNIARWGHTLEQILQAKEYLKESPRFKPDWFIVSAGGNDLQESLGRGELVLRFDPARPIDQCLSPAGNFLLQKIATNYHSLLSEIAASRPAFSVICFAYDFPRPTFKGGKYIGRFLDKVGYPKSTWDAVGRMIIDRLSAVLEPAVTAFPFARFLDCRGITKAHPFYDDMHPATDGFKALAARYEKEFGVATKKARSASKRRASPKRAARRK